VHGAYSTPPSSQGLKTAKSHKTTGSCLRATDMSRSDLAEQRAGRPVSFEFFSQSLTLSLISQPVPRASNCLCFFL
jgi:hypothetical protein